MDDDYIRLQLRRFRQGDEYWDLLHGVQCLVLYMPLLVVVWTPIAFVIVLVSGPFTTGTTWLIFGWTILGNLLYSLYWLVSGMLYLRDFRRGRLEGFGYWNVLRVALSMTRKDLFIFSVRPRR